MYLKVQSSFIARLEMIRPANQEVAKLAERLFFFYFYFYLLKFFADDHLLLVKVHIMYILLVSVLTNDGEKMNLHANFINVWTWLYWTPWLRTQMHNWPRNEYTTFVYSSLAALNSVQISPNLQTEVKSGTYKVLEPLSPLVRLHVLNHTGIQDQKIHKHTNTMAYRMLYV